MVEEKNCNALLSMDEVVSKKTKLRIGEFDQIKARNRAIFSEMLAKANALQSFRSSGFPLGASKKRTKVARPGLVRFTISLSNEEFAEILKFKGRIAGLGGKVKSSELLRGGLALLATLDDADLDSVLKRASCIHT